MLNIDEQLKEALTEIYKIVFKDYKTMLFIDNSTDVSISSLNLVKTDISGEFEYSDSGDEIIISFDTENIQTILEKYFSGVLLDMVHSSSMFLSYDKSNGTVEFNISYDVIATCLDGNLLEFVVDDSPENIFEHVNSLMFTYFKEHE